MTASTRHRWGDKVRFPYKTEQQCIRCGLVKVSRHESEGGRDVYGTELWRDGELIQRNGATPQCDARWEVTA